MGPTACTRPQCLYSTATPLLCLGTVQLVQNIGACTAQLKLYSSNGRYSLYRPSERVQYIYIFAPGMCSTDSTMPQYFQSTAKPLQLFGLHKLYRTSELVKYIYTSTPHMIRTSFTEIGCLYNTPKPLHPYGLYSLQISSVLVQFG